MFNLNKNVVVGVSVSPELGLEVAQVDFATRTVLKYACRKLEYDNMRREIADRDVFKQDLGDMLEELQIPKGSEVVINLPPVVFKVTDYPASLAGPQIQSAIEEELLNHSIFQDADPCISAVGLPNSTIQFTKVAYTVAQKAMLEELVYQIKELGYKLLAVDTSVNSTLNALIYNDRVDVAPDAMWVLLLVENNYCRIVSMHGRNYVDYFEERISIGAVLGDEENYSTVLGAISPILKNLPSQRLYVVSKTNVISAKKLAEQLNYKAQIIHQEANMFSTAPFIEVSENVDDQLANFISLDVIGAAIYKDFLPYSNAHLNLFNESLGEIYFAEQPLTLNLGAKTLVLSLPNMIVASIVVAIIVVIATVATILPIAANIGNKESEIAKIEKDINTIQAFLKANEQISTEEFSESDNIKIGISNNKKIYSYYTIVGTEIPKKLWLTSLNLGRYTTIEGQADNLESVYSFYRNIKDYNPNNNIKLQHLGLATASSKLKAITDDELFDTDSIITSMNADFYEFRISNAPEIAKKIVKKKSENKHFELEPLE